MEQTIAMEQAAKKAKAKAAASGPVQPWWVEGKADAAESFARFEKIFEIEWVQGAPVGKDPKDGAVMKAPALQTKWDLGSW